LSSSVLDYVARNREFKTFRGWENSRHSVTIPEYSKWLKTTRYYGEPEMEYTNGMELHEQKAYDYLNDYTNDAKGFALWVVGGVAFILAVVLYYVLRKKKKGIKK
jgi:hypothetical protein